MLDAHAEVGESPVWDADRDELIWVDIPRGLVHRLDPASGRNQPFAAGQPVGAVALRSAGGLVLAMRDGFGLLDTAAHEVRLVRGVEPDRPGNRMNDGGCDGRGRFWAGTMAVDETRHAGSLYRLDPDLHVEHVLGETTISNGIDWSLDGHTMYYVDSAVGGVDCFDYDAEVGAVSSRRRLVDVPAADGLPDGLTVDAEGFIWVALWGGSAVHRYGPDGTLDAVVPLPVTQVTSCAFGGADLDELFVTSAAEGIAEDQLRRQPHAGGVFRVRPGCRGRAPNRFGG